MIRKLTSLPLMIAAFGATAAAAQTPSTAPTGATAEPKESPTPTKASPFSSPALNVDVLGAATAREDISQVASSEQTATVSGNSVNGQSTTGALNIDGNAFQNQSGLTIVNANTGNNVAVNASMNVNIVFTPPPQQ